MTYEEMERAIESLLEHHARFNEDIDRIKDVQVKTTNDLQLLTGKLLALTENITRVETEAETNRQETRDAINKLILANEVTRSLAQDVARLAIATSQRVTTLEEKLP